jgi:hypothetical protein
MAITSVKFSTGPGFRRSGRRVRLAQNRRRLPGMKRISVVVLVASIGCGLQIGEPDTVDVAVTWSIRDFETGATGCPAAFPRIRIGFAKTDESIPHYFIKTFDCAPGGATLPMWEPGFVEDVDGGGATHDYEVTGKYVVIVQLIGAQEQSIHGESLPYEIDVTKGERTLAAKIVPGGNFFLPTWTLRSAADEAMTCEMAGVTDVEVTYRIYDDRDPPIVDRYPCAIQADGTYPEGSGSTYSAATRIESYTISARALGAGGVERGRAEEFPAQQYPPGQGSLYAVTYIPFDISVP